MHLPESTTFAAARRQCKKYALRPEYSITVYLPKFIRFSNKIRPFKRMIENINSIKYTKTAEL